MITHRFVDFIGVSARSWHGPTNRVVDDSKYSFFGMMCQPRLSVARGAQSALEIRDSQVLALKRPGECLSTEHKNKKSLKLCAPRRSFSNRKHGGAERRNTNRPGVEHIHNVLEVLGK
jgi:hypothetical protein